MFTNRVGFLFKSTSIAFALVTLLSLGAFFVGEASSRSQNELDFMEIHSGRLPPDEADLTSTSGKNAAPGYCFSSGGSKAYEYISSVSLTPNPGGTMKLTVQVFIANPGGCTAGEACEEYDPSPEYVNVWIDWNGDKTWEPSEKVMDKALTGYLSINYRGTMTAVTQFTPPSTGVTSEPTWMRANLGWDYDPNDPCESSWSWGNVVDKQLHLKGPEVKSITAKGIGAAGDNPTTGKPVRLEAEIDVPADYELTQCSWTGDLTAGNGDKANKCRYEYTPSTGAGPAANTYGEKNITLNLSYKHTASGASGQTSNNHIYKVFFDKGTAAAWADDDGDGEPNWFEYWADDSAVAGLGGSDVEFDQTLGNNSYGYWSPADDDVHIGGAAALTHYTGGINVPAAAAQCPGGNFGNVTGIDSATEVLVHERRHETIYHNWDEGGGWNPNPGAPLADSDDTNHPTKHDRPGDDLPDTYETAAGTANNNVDSCNLATHKSPTYSTYGDNEFDAMKTSDGSTGTAANDWTNPGKQSNPAFALLQVQSSTGILPSVKSGESGSLAPFGVAAVRAADDLGNLTGSYSDQGVDSDNDGKFNSLQLSVGVQIDQASLYNVVAWLENSSSTPIVWASTQEQLAIGTHTVDVFFEGEVIRGSKLDGPYTIARVELREGDEEYQVDSGDSVHSTGAYQWDDFDIPPVAFTGVYTDTLVDSGSNGLYDFLNIQVELDVQQGKVYMVVGELEGPTGAIVVAQNSTTLAPGTRTINLNFDGKTIFFSRQDGPYYVKSLRVEDAGGNRLGFVYDAYTADSATYTYSMFEHGPNTLESDSYTDQGIDVDADDDYDYLRVALGINLASDGEYRVQATLKDSLGEKVTDLIQDFNLLAGSQTVNLDFSGGDIYKHGVDGPYQVSSVSLFDDGGGLLDYQPVAHTTGSYASTDFSPPLVSVSSSLLDYGEDTDGNGKFDVLKVDIGVTPGDAGVIVVQARLVDKVGRQIEWVETNGQLNAGSEQTITLSFDGALIGANGVDGPFEVRDLIVYHTGDPNQDYAIALAHTTKAYSLTEFEGGSYNVYLPLSLR
jgi:hypothetical protein